MAHPISTLGILHTVISLIPIIAGLYAFARYREIAAATPSGKVYLIGLILSVITSFSVSSTGGLNPGHAFGVIVLIVAFSGVLAPKLKFFGRLRPYISAFGLSFSFLLSLVPATNETLTRVPVSHPVADGPQSPAVLNTLLVLLVLFAVGFIVQCRVIYRRNKAEKLAHNGAL